MHSYLNTLYPIMPPELLERYLSLLGIQRRTPSVDALCELVQPHTATSAVEKTYPSCTIKSIRDCEASPILKHSWMASSASVLAGHAIPIITTSINWWAAARYQSDCAARICEPRCPFGKHGEYRETEISRGRWVCGPVPDSHAPRMKLDYTIVPGRERYVLKPQIQEAVLAWSYIRWKPEPWLFGKTSTQTD